MRACVRACVRECVRASVFVEDASLHVGAFLEVPAHVVLGATQPSPMSQTGLLSFQFGDHCFLTRYCMRTSLEGTSYGDDGLERKV